MEKVKRVTIAQETLNILKTQEYINNHGLKVDLSSQIQLCVERTKYYESDILFEIKQEILTEGKKFTTTEFEVFNETTLQGAEALSKEEANLKIGVLNFASAKNPGGGFRRGAHAQEESLARSSGLYLSLLQAPDYYNSHRKQKSCLYSDRMIYSPMCPVFRQDNGNLLDQPYIVDFLTSPAPNTGVVKKKEPEKLAKIEAILTERISKILALFAYYGCDCLVLGAWGCGVFQNDPNIVARIFYNHLTSERMRGKFKKIRFSVVNKSKNTNICSIFEEVFRIKR
jgi:uncharacterized protein (TIGR02452 family)